MSVIGKLFKARDKPRNSLNGGAYSFFFGSTASGKAVNERSAMQMSAVYACVRILSEAVPGLPLHLYSYTDSGGKEKALAHPLYTLLHDEPNPEMSAFSFRETLMTHLLLWGQNVTLQVAMEALQEQADGAGIPLAFREDTLKTGGLFSKQVEDILIMYNPEHESDYLRFAIRIQHMGKYAFMHVFNLGGSKNYGHDNAAGAGSTFRKMANLVGGHNAKLQAEEQYYAILKDCIDNVVS